jgi:hypothetical protein
MGTNHNAVLLASRQSLLGACLINYIALHAPLKTRVGPAVVEPLGVQEPTFRSQREAHRVLQAASNPRSKNGFTGLRASCTWVSATFYTGSANNNLLQVVRASTVHSLLGICDWAEAVTARLDYSVSQG